MSDDVTFLSQLVRDSMELQAQEVLNKTDQGEIDIMEPLQVKYILVSQMNVYKLQEHSLG